MQEETLAALCAALPRMRQQAVRSQAVVALNELVNKARAGVGISELVALAERWGVDIELGTSSRADTMPALPGIFGRAPLVQIYTCPGGTCTRRWVRSPGVMPPMCEVHEQPLRKPDLS